MKARAVKRKAAPALWSPPTFLLMSILFSAAGVPYVLLKNRLSQTKASEGEDPLANTVNGLLAKHMLCQNRKGANLGLDTFLRVERAGHGTRYTYRVVKYKWETLPEGRRNCRGGLPSKESVRRAATAHLGAYAACGSATGYAFYVTSQAMLRDYVRSRDATATSELGDVSLLGDSDALAAAMSSRPKKDKMELSPQEEVEKRRWRDVCLSSGTLPDWGPRNERASASKCGHRIFIDGTNTVVECSPPDAPETAERAIAYALAESDAKAGITKADKVLPCLLSCAKATKEVALSRPPLWLRGGGSRSLRATTAEDLPKAAGLGWIFATKIADAHALWLPSAVRSSHDPLQLLHDVVIPYISAMELPERETKNLNGTAGHDATDPAHLPSRFLLMHAGGGGMGNALEKPSRHGTGASSAFPPDSLGPAKAMLAPFAERPPIAIADLPRRVHLEGIILGSDVPYGADGWGRGALRLREKGLMGLADLATFVRRYDDNAIPWRHRCPRAVVCLEPGPALGPLVRALDALAKHYDVFRGRVLPRCSILEAARTEAAERAKRRADAAASAGDLTDVAQSKDGEIGREDDDDDATRPDSKDPASAGHGGESTEGGEGVRRRALMADDECADDVLRVVLASHGMQQLPSISIFRDALKSADAGGRRIEVEEVDAADYDLRSSMQLASSTSVLIAATGSAVGTIAPFLPDGAVVVSVGPPMGAAALGGGISRSSAKRRKRRRDIQRALLPRRGGLRYIEWNPPPLEEALKVLKSASLAKHSGGWASKPHDSRKRGNLVGKLLDGSHGSTSQSEEDDDTVAASPANDPEAGPSASTADSDIAEAEGTSVSESEEMDLEAAASDDSANGSEELEVDTPETPTLDVIEEESDIEEADAANERRRTMLGATKRRTAADESNSGGKAEELDEPVDVDAESDDGNGSVLTFEKETPDASDDGVDRAADEVEDMPNTEDAVGSLEGADADADATPSPTVSKASEDEDPEDTNAEFRIEAGKDRTEMEREWVFALVTFSLDLVGMGIGDARGSTELRDASYR